MATYKDAGVDIEAAEEAVEKIKKLVASTHQPWVLSDIGPFGSLLDINLLCNQFENPIDVKSIDGVGTKMTIAEKMNKFNTIGMCLVNHCANDIVTMGPVMPVSFLNYIGVHPLSPDIQEQIITGMAKACVTLRCPIIGGEMAEMPGVYQKNRHEIVGQITGMVEREEIIDGTLITPGNTLIGLASSGLHTNGYSLAIKVLFEEQGLHVRSNVAGLRTELGSELLKPHRCYFNTIHSVLSEGIKINGVAHVTGGGIKNNLIRILPDSCMAVINKNCWKPQQIFRIIQGDGCVSEDEMYHVFNMGVGMIVVVPTNEADKAIERLAFHLKAQENGDEVYAFKIGSIKDGDKGVELI